MATKTCIRYQDYVRVCSLERGHPLMGEMLITLPINIQYSGTVAVGLGYLACKPARLNAQVGSVVLFVTPHVQTLPRVVSIFDRNAISSTEHMYHAIRQAAPLAAEILIEMDIHRCARCKRTYDWFRVSDKQWAKLPERWVEEAICRKCFDTLTSK